jgi:hypothetical protein
MKVNLTVKVDRDISDRLAALSIRHGLSQGELVRRSIRAHYGIVPPGRALAAALSNADAPWVRNGQGADG